MPDYQTTPDPVEMSTAELRDEFIASMGKLFQDRTLPDVYERRYATEPTAVRAAELWEEMRWRGVELSGC